MKVVVGITGASGAIYAREALKKLETLKSQVDEVGVVISNNGRQVWEHELGNTDYKTLSFPVFGPMDFNAPFASGSAGYRTMIVVPCSMGTLGRIANGFSDDLLTRAADVILKERGRLILVLRDTPFNIIHINNMKAAAEAGAIIFPASPSFYSHPEDFNQLAATVVDRVLQLAGLELETYRWGNK